MTNLFLLYTECIICGKTFMSYFPAFYDKIQRVYWFYELGFLDLEFDGTMLYPIKNIRKCRACRKSHQLEEYPTC